MRPPRPAARLALLVLGVAVAGWLGARIDTGVAPPKEAVHWVRTVDGWEKAVWRDRPRESPQVHPLVLGAFLGLASTLSLLALPTRDA